MTPPGPKPASVLILGSGPVVIGQAAEFDYAGTQACRALRAEGVRTILINSNPATIMTDPSVADAIYLEPLTVEVVEAVIAKEQPEGLLAGLGGQTALNLVTAMARAGVFERHPIRLLGTPLEAIHMAEDREAFRDLLDRIDQPYAPSFIVEGATPEEREHATQEALETIGLPAIVRPAFTLGGTGGGIVENEAAYREIVRTGLRASPIGQVMVEKCLVGWQEIEYEVMRDADDTCIAVCSMENVDPLGVHTGDSIVVAPVQTLSDAVHQRLRSAALAIIRALGVEGGCNVQFALSPDSTEYAVIEVNPRVSRSSALASKATGYPIARVAAQIAVGRRLAEIPNVVTGTTVAAFEPALDYVVVKLPRFPFDKFPTADRTLGSQMKATGEVMAIDRTFGSALNKALRGLEQAGVGPLAEDPSWTPTFDYLAGVYAGDPDADEPIHWVDERGQACESTRHAQRTAAPLVLRRFLEPSDSRLWRLLGLLRRGVPEHIVKEATGISAWFLGEMGRNVALEHEVTAAGRAAGGPRRRGRRRAAGHRQASRVRRQGAGGSRRHDPRGAAGGTTRARHRARLLDGRHLRRRVRGRDAVFLCNVCSGGLGTGGAARRTPRRARDRLGTRAHRPGHRVRLLRRPGRGHAAPQRLAGRDDQFEPGNGLDRLRRLVATLFRATRPGERAQRHRRGIAGRRGTPAGRRRVRRPDAAEPGGATGRGRRARCSAATSRPSTRPRSGSASRPCSTALASRSPRAAWPIRMEEALTLAERIGYPVIVRPSFVIGGLAIDFCYSPEDLARQLAAATVVDPDRPVRIDRYLEGVEVDVDAVSDGELVLIPGLLEHVERAGVHSGDSVGVFPPQFVSEGDQDLIVATMERIVLALGAKGLVNAQFIVRDDGVYLIEVNPRASRTVPFMSKVTGVPMVELAVRIALGATLPELGWDGGLLPAPPYFAVKAPAFSTTKLRGVDPSVGPGMQSTGEVIGLHEDPRVALAKALLGAALVPPRPGEAGALALLSIADRDKALLPRLATGLAAAGYRLAATPGHATGAGGRRVRGAAGRQARRGRRRSHGRGPDPGPHRVRARSASSSTRRRPARARSGTRSRSASPRRGRGSCA